MTNIDRLLSTYPRHRSPLPNAYQCIYEQEYQLNRTGGTIASKLTQLAESWMHRIIAKSSKKGSILEIGAGTLNHLPYESTQIYDVVEPFEALYSQNPYCVRVRHFFQNVAKVPKDMLYDRIISIAVLEHLDTLPEIIAHTALLLNKKGLFQHCIPSEGGFLWGLGWRLTTGISFRLRNGIPYRVLMTHEHINKAREIILIIRWFFNSVELRRFPLPVHHLSLYTYIQASDPKIDRCQNYLHDIKTNSPIESGGISINPWSGQ